jgi:hypothetical protein
MDDAKAKKMMVLEHVGIGVTVAIMSQWHSTPG